MRSSLDKFGGGRTLPREVASSLVEALYSTPRSIVSGAAGSMIVAGSMMYYSLTWGALVASFSVVMTAALRITLPVLWTRRTSLLASITTVGWERAYAIVGALYSAAIGGMAYFSVKDGMDKNVTTLVLLFSTAYVGLLPARSGLNPRIVMAQALLTVVPGAAGFLFSNDSYSVYVPLAAIAFLLSISDVAKALYRMLVEMVVSRERLDAALNNMSHALVMIDEDMRIQVANAQFRRLFDIPDDAVALGSDVRAAATMVLELTADRDERRALNAAFLRFLERKSAVKLVVHMRDGRALEFSLQPMAGGMVAAIEDVTARDEAHRKMVLMAKFDALTGLPNRASFGESVEAAVASGELEFAVLAVDLDRFKQVNDTLGHPAGDKLLTMVAKRLSGLVRDRDVVSRFGGDEFVVLARRLGRKGAEALANEIVQRLSMPYDIDGARASIGASVGIAIAGEHGRQAEELMRRADIALYDAKESGRGIHSVFHEDMERLAARRRKTEMRLREALADGRLEVWYQPVFDVASGKATVCEALVRWRNEDGAVVPPSEFIKAAEETGFIVEMGDWVLARACRDAISWPDGIRVAVNYSPVQFSRTGVVAAVERALALTGLDPSRLELEVAEATVSADQKVSLDTVRSLRLLGVRICFDDFGRGASSLACLDAFRPDRVKMDRSFVRGISAKASASLAIVRAIAAMSEALGFSFVASGVESREQLDAMHEAGAKEAQGYLFGHPVPAAEVKKVLFGRPRLAA